LSKKASADAVVTIFTRHLDRLIMTPNLSSVYQIRNAGSGQFLPTGQIYLSPIPIAIGMAKIPPPTLSAYTRESS
jgi:hypothetical protein